jgi:hypothetical protein
MMRRIPDLSRTKALLSWQPGRALSEIIADVVDYESRSVEAQPAREPAFSG